MIEVIPSILVKTKEELQAQIKKFESVVERVHVDIMDGSFGLSKTDFGPEEIRSLDTKLMIGVHLMVIHPQSHLPNWFTTKVDRIFIHAEAEGDLKELLVEIKAQGKKAGIVLNLDTDSEAITECFSVVDYVQFMSVRPGSNGGVFLTDAVDRVLNFHDLYPEIKIAVDGGMNPQTSQLVRSVGAQVIVSGSYISNATDISKAIAELKGDSL